MKRTPERKRAVGRRPAGKPERGTRSEILASARRVFARKGFDGTSMREVADAARVNNAMIYYHFKNKVELYRAVLSDSFTAFDRIWDHDIFSGPATARQQIRQYVEELILFHQANEELRRIISMEFATSGRNLKWLAEHLFRHSNRKLERIIRQGIRSGELKRMDPQVAIAALVGMIIHTFIMRPVAEFVSGRVLNLSARRFGDFVCEMFFDGLGVLNRKSTRASALLRRTAEA